MKISSLALIAALSFATPSMAQDMTPEQVKKLALEAILENPQIIMDAVAILRQREEAAEKNAQAQGLSDNQDLLVNDANAPVLGNPDGDVTIVEFFDYNCGYCKRAVPALQAVLENDPNIRVVFREFPILSEGSVVASRAALASRKQGKYEEFHWALMGARGLDENSVLQLAAQIGLDVEQLQADMQAPEIDEHIATSRELADALKFTGTPAFVIGDNAVPGFIPQEAIEGLIAETREKRG
jgi:protein-disulfide isomerase